MMNQMSQALELLIEEPVAGQFLWKVLKPIGSGIKPHIVDFAMGPLPSRQAALDAGNASMTRNGAGSGAAWSGDYADTLPMEL